MVDYRTYLVVNHFAFWSDLYAHIIGSDRIYWNGTDFAVHGDDLGHMATVFLNLSLIVINVVQLHRLRKEKKGQGGKNDETDN